MEIIDEDQVMGEDDDLPLSCFGNEPLGNLVPPAMIKRCYGVVKNKGRCVRV